MVRWLIIAIFLGICLGPLARAQEVALRPEQILEQKYGLVRPSVGTVWMTPLEAELRGHIQSLTPLRSAISDLEKQLAERVDQNAKAWEASRRAEVLLAARLAALKADDKARAAVERDLAAARAAAIAPDKLGDQPQVRALVIELINRRHALAHAAAAIRHAAPLVPDSYAPLARQVEVRQLLRQAGRQFRLGPQRDYADDVKRLPDFERAVFTDWAPLYLQGERLRLTALINGDTPVTFTFSSGAEPATIAATAAEKLGLEPAPGAKHQTITPVRGRTYRVLPAKLTSLRLGAMEVRDVEVLLLPPEAEDLGSQIGAAAFSGYRVTADPVRLRWQVGS